MGLSVAKDELYYIYVLRVEGNGWYVGSTQSFERRMRSHFGKGGAVATKERRALEIEEVFELRDYQIRTDCAHERAEVLIAQRYAQLYGMNSVRGAKHGKGWNDQPSPGSAVFQAMFSVALHFSGRLVSAECPCVFGPRNCGQFCA